MQLYIFSEVYVSDTILPSTKELLQFIVFFDTKLQVVKEAIE